MLLALIRKEILLLLRDKHALVTLFVMPAMFIVVMSLALKDIYRPRIAQLNYAVQAASSDYLVDEALARWQAQHGAAQIWPADVSEALRRGQLAYVLHLDSGFHAALTATTPADAPQARLVVEPGLDARLMGTLEAELAALVGELRAEAVQEKFMGLTKKGSQSIRRLVSAERIALSARPTAIQQNVPAWLVFGMFFVTAALAGMLVQERENRSLARLLSLGVSIRAMLAAKALPYVGVGVLQAALMLAIGVWLMPILSGEGLSLAGMHWGALALVLLSISCAAIALGLALASVVRSHAQASTSGPILNVLMAALGGIMVPAFMMPPVMQTMASFSPMNWGLEGMLSVILRHGDMTEAWPYAARLLAFALLMLGLAALRMRHTRGA